MIEEEGYRISEQETYIEVDGETRRTVTFEIDKSRSYGILNITEEISLQYEPESGKWYGETIDPDGWYDLDEDQIQDLVDELGLEEVAEDVAAEW